MIYTEHSTDKDASSVTETGKTILIIEDDNHLRHYLGELLELSGFKVILAGDGHQGLLKFQQFKPQLVLTDIVMPGRDGISLTVRFKRLCPEVAVIAMSGRWLSDDVDCSDSVSFLGIDKVLSKPFSAAQLKEAILHVTHTHML